MLPGRPAIVLDVAHNPHAARALADNLGAMGFHPRTIAVFGMLADKDIDGVIDAAEAAHRSLARRDAAGAARRDAPTRCATRCATPASRRSAIREFDDDRAPRTARRARRRREADRIVVFGSFLTVAAALARDASEPVPRRMADRIAESPTSPSTS